MRSKVAQQILDEMELDSWYVKLMRWIRLKRWVFICMSRKYWDKDF